MKKIIAVSVLILVVTLALVGCTGALKGNAMLGFDAQEVTKIILINGDRVEKDLTHKKDEIFAVLNGIEFSPTAEEKYENNWGLDYGFAINFYIEGYAGYYSLVTNHGGRAIEGYNNKKSKIGFYDANNKIALNTALNDIFYL